MTHTCQICGRVIKANTGLIAHHGYKRPAGWHSQTRSCFGARFQPYEQAHDALDKYIVLLAKWLVDAKASLAAWIANPPAELILQRRSAWGEKRGEPITLVKPEGFDPAELKARGCYRSQTYDASYAIRRGEMEMAVRGLVEETEFVTERLVAWRAAA